VHPVGFYCTDLPDTYNAGMYSSTQFGLHVGTKASWVPSLPSSLPQK